MPRTSKSEAINAAVAAFRRGDFADYIAVAKHYSCDRTSVSKRIRGLTKTRQEANSFFRQCLTNT